MADRPNPVHVVQSPSRSLHHAAVQGFCPNQGTATMMLQGRRDRLFRRFVQTREQQVDVEQTVVAVVAVLRAALPPFSIRTAVVRASEA